MAEHPETSRPERQRYRIAQLMEATNKSKLKNAARLHAAHFVGRLFDRAVHAGTSREVLEQRIAEQLGKAKVASSAFRIERWRLRKAVTEINDGLVKNWGNKSEPQRKEAVYYHIVHTLCEQLGEDPLTEQIKLHELIDRRADNEASGDDEVDPARRVASLFRHMTRAVAVEQDLAALWSQAQALNVGSDLIRGPVVVPITENLRGPVWRGGYLMPSPCPAAHLISVPLMQADTMFDITPVDKGAGCPCPAHGIFNLFFDIHLILHHDGSGVALPHLAFVFRHELTLDQAVQFPGFEGRGRTSYGHEEITSLGEFSSNAVEVTTSDGQQWLVEAGPDWDWDEHSGSEVFSSGYDFCRWEVGAEDFFAEAELAPGTVPVDAHALTKWLAVSSDNGLLPPGAAWRLELASHGEGSVSASSGTNGGQETAAFEPWFRRPGFQQKLERALNDGTLESSLQEWIQQYRVTLAGEAGLWRRRAEDSEARLRARWQGTIRRVTGLGPVNSDFGGDQQ